MTPTQQQHVQAALDLLTSPYVLGNRERLGTVGELDLLSAIQQLRKALPDEEAHDQHTPDFAARIAFGQSVE